ncbi:MAG: tetratricopeptide repeat protein [Deltaproteobacteria bacterium]|nr:tetratricopeptide repeat protein [Deltaproteobacteria bacterium]
MRHLLFTAALAALATAALAPTTARADDGPSSSDHRQANALYKEGVRLYNKAEYASALDLFENAYHRYPDPRILFSIATSLRQMGRTVDAANAYQRFVDDPGAEPALVADTQTVLKVLDATVGRIDLAFDGPAGEIQVEDGVWLPEGTAHVRVLPGSFIVRARRDGFTGETTGRVAAGAAITVTLTWTAKPVEPVARPKTTTTTPTTTTASAAPSTASALTPPAPVRTAPPAPSHRRTFALASGGAGLALAAGAIVLELGARSRIADAEAACPQLRCAEPAHGQAQALLDAAQGRRTTALVLGGLATVGVAAGAALWLTGRAPDSALRVAPTTGDHSVGLTILGRF